MRKLTITRKKSFVASLAKYKIYIEDENSDDIVINGVSCRKLGEIKNAESQSFDIDDSAAKVFVIADKLSKNYCNDYYELPEGQDDIFLSGKATMSAGLGNPFCFDNNNNEQVIKHRKKVRRNGIIAIVVIFVVSFAVGFAYGFLDEKADMKKEETFKTGEMSITLTKAFEDMSGSDFSDFTAAYGSEDVAVFVLAEDCAPYDITLEEYAEAFAEDPNVPLQRRNGLSYFEYDYYDAAEGDTYVYFAFLYQRDTTFWSLQFAIDQSDYNKYIDRIFEWASTVRFDN